MSTALAVDLVPFPRVAKPWFLGREPLAGTGTCRYCSGHPSVVVDGREVCRSHVGTAVTDAANQHAVGYEIAIDAAERRFPDAHPALLPVAWIDPRTGEEVPR